MSTETMVNITKATTAESFPNPPKRKPNPELACCLETNTIVKKIYRMLGGDTAYALLPEEAETETSQ
jgi:hypothetical protein